MMLLSFLSVLENEDHLLSETDSSLFSLMSWQRLRAPLWIVTLLVAFFLQHYLLSQRRQYQNQSRQQNDNNNQQDAQRERRRRRERYSSRLLVESIPTDLVLEESVTAPSADIAKDRLDTKKKDKQQNGTKKGSYNKVDKINNTKVFVEKVLPKNDEYDTNNQDKKETNTSDNFHIESSENSGNNAVAVTIEDKNDKTALKHPIKQETADLVSENTDQESTTVVTNDAQDEITEPAITTPPVVTSTAPASRKVTPKKTTSASNIPTKPFFYSTNAHLPKNETTDDVCRHVALREFGHWMDTTCSLFRIYCVGQTGVDIVPPYNPSSRRGVVSVHLKVTNRMATPVRVYWVDYKGAEISKGTIRKNETWTQSTWIEHPWVFRTSSNVDSAENDTGLVLLHYIPYRIIPTTRMVHTTRPDDPSVGIHTFELHDPAVLHWGQTAQYTCRVHDAVLPFPALDCISSRQAALDWTFHHCLRMGWHGWDVLLTYLRQIVQHPAITQYRQIRLATPTFASTIWNAPARGLLFAVGFVEHHGYAEYGSSENLPDEWKDRLTDLIRQTQQWQQQFEFENNNTNIQQPDGADGYGLAGYGRAGAMND